MKMWLSIEWLYYLFGLELCEGEIVEDKAYQKHWIQWNIYCCKAFHLKYFILNYSAIIEQISITSISKKLHMICFILHLISSWKILCKCIKDILIHYILCCCSQRYSHWQAHSQFWENLEIWHAVNYFLINILQNLPIHVMYTFYKENLKINVILNQPTWIKQNDLS